MTFLIGRVTKGRWNSTGLTWLPPGDAPASALLDFRFTDDNRLSSWLVDDDSCKLEDVVIALASTRDYLAKFDYYQVPVDEVKALEIAVEETPGQTVYAEASDCHRDLTKLSSTRVAGFAKLIMAHDRQRISRSEVGGLLAGAIKGGKIRLDQLKEHLRTAIQEFLPA